MSAIETRPVLQDLNVIVSGHGGDGSLTVITLLAEVMRQSGLNAYTERNVRSRIKGGIVSASLRVFKGKRFCIGSHIDLLVAFDQEAVEQNLHHLDENSRLIYDDSGGELPEGLLPEGVRVYHAPFSRQAIRTFRRDLFKNSVAFAVVGRLLGINDDVMCESFHTRFTRMGEKILNYNLQALAVGFDLADGLALPAGDGRYQIVKNHPKPHMLIIGNHAVAFGFLVAGGRFFSGYPITPSTDVMEWLAKWLPKFGGVVRQVEDELSAVNMAIGAALTGTRAMIATCGPGLALMQEGISQLGMAEIPLVIVDAQRGGPSTGLPTKPEQSDLNMMVFGGNGDFPRIVLAPGHPEDCFYLGAQACNLAQKYQLPVYIALDQGLSQNLATVDPFDLDRITVDQGKRLDSKDLEKLPIYKRYAFTEDGVSPYTVPGTPGGLSLVTGNEHDEFGLVSTNFKNRIKMMDKRQKKLETMLPDLPKANRFGDLKAKIGFIGIGMSFGVILEAIEELAEQGVNTQYFQLRTVWPMLDETLDFVAACQHVYVVEYNATGQLAKLLVREGADGQKLRNILKYDGVPLRPIEVVKHVLQHEGMVNAQ